MGVNQVAYPLSAQVIANSLLRRVEELSGQNIDLCYQCGKCSATCPLSAYMDLLPHQVVRMLQLGMGEVFDSNSHWLCAACYSCETQCPRGIDVSRICEALRTIRLRASDHELELDKPTLQMPQQGLVSAFRKHSSY
jgi:heterodisulfide reductase subunit C